MPSVGHALGRLGLKTSFFHLVGWGGWKRVVFWRAFPPPPRRGLESGALPSEGAGRENLGLWGGVSRFFLVVFDGLWVDKGGIR